MGVGESGMGRWAGKIITELQTFGRRPNSNSALALTLSSAFRELMDSVTKKFKASSLRCSAGLVGPTWLCHNVVSANRVAWPCPVAQD